MNVLLQFLFGMIQGVIPDFITSIKKSLNNKTIAKFLDYDGDGDFDIHDIKALSSGLKVGQFIAIIASGLLIFILFEYYTTIRPNL